MPLSKEAGRKQINSDNQIMVFLEVPHFFCHPSATAGQFLLSQNNNKRQHWQHQMHFICSQNSIKNMFVKDIDSRIFYCAVLLFYFSFNIRICQLNDHQNLSVKIANVVSLSPILNLMDRFQKLFITTLFFLRVLVTGRYKFLKISYYLRCLNCCLDFIF